MRAGEATEVDLAAGLVETFLMRVGLLNFVMVKKKVEKRGGCGVRMAGSEKKVEEMFEIVGNFHGTGMYGWLLQRWMKSSGEKVFEDHVTCTVL
jgi:hypothetical protein